ncbi:MAG: aminotransferase class III-fold pyridoxal phosphate-dependent enzyme, partial [Pseudomonadota bacterium]|nr:aminotransferase class III-fold pyridoxal phosphate-dependent enzyme [Pseudomonadota bacterium]
IHALRDKAPLTDIRNIGLMGALDLEPDPAGPGLRAIGVFERAWEAGVVVRMTGDTIALCPPLITKPDELDAMFDGLECALAGI